MKLVQRAIILIMLLTSLSGCKLDLPTPKSGDAQRFKEGASIQPWSLNEKQLNALEAWFKDHQSGWSPSYVSYVPGVYVTVWHNNGKQSSINIWPQKIIVDFGGNSFEQKFDPPEIKGLLYVIGAVDR